MAEFFGHAHGTKDASGDADFVIETPNARFVAEYKVSSQASSVAGAIARIRTWRTRKHEVPLLVVAFMGQVGKELCAAQQIPWVDLSGNAHIQRPGLFVHVEGRPNRYKSPGRPESVFSPTASRVTRWLLAHPAESFLQTEIATATSLDEGFVSRIVRRLIEQQLLVRTQRRLRVRDAGLLLSSWYEAYDFSQHLIFRAHGVARTSEALCKNLSTHLVRSGIEHAATGLAGAWLRTRFAGFRLVTFFVELAPDDNFYRQLHVRPVDRGENVWLVVPRDSGVFVPTQELDGIRCVHDAQLYVDLKGQPERSAEAAEVVRTHYLEGVRGSEA